MLNFEWITENWTWFLTPVAIMGGIITNFCWMIVDFQAHEFDTRLLAQSAQHAIFFILAWHGLMSWKRIEKANGGTK